MASTLNVPHADDMYDSETSQESPPRSAIQRRPSESSTERSLYDEKDQAAINTYEHPTSSQHTLANVREYGFYHPTVLSRGLVITANDTAPLSANHIPLPSAEGAKTLIYYVEVSEFTLKKPDIILHAISSHAVNPKHLDHIATIGESGPVIGVAHMPRFSRDYKVGLGDPSASPIIPWVDIVNPNTFSHGEYRFTYNGATYAWKRTHDHDAGVEGGSVRRVLNKDSFQLINLSTNEVLAVFLANKLKSWKKRGKLRLYKELDEGDKEAQEQGKQLTLLVFVSIAAILEKARRRSNARRSGGGGGGGP